MIDYHAHAAGLERVLQALDAVAGGGDRAAEWAVTGNAVAAEPACALLGALFDHLLERAEGADWEHALLEEAASLFNEAETALAEFAAARSEFEGIVKVPGSATTVQYDGLLGRLEELHPELEALRQRVKAYNSRLNPPYEHVRQHGIAADQPVSAWLWRDVVLSRRTDALVATFQTTGDASAATKAFAFGALAGYAGNCVGSAYLAHAVRGPRRSHPHRDRVGRYAVGAWLRTNQPALCPSLTELRTRLQSAAPTLPAAIREQITAALAIAFPAGAPAVAPDLETGYLSLLRHLELLDTFHRQPIPSDIDATLLVRVLLSPAAANTLNNPLDDMPPFNDPPPGTEGHDGTVPPIDPGAQPGTPKKSVGACGVALLVITIAGMIIYRLAAGRWPWESEPAQPANPDGNPRSNPDALKVFLESDDALQTVARFYNAHTLLAQAVADGLKHLKWVGLIYPDEIDLMEESFGQFTALPARAPFPRRPAPDSDLPLSHLGAPASAVEEPGTHSSQYPAGATPAVFLVAAADGLLPTVGEVGAELWLRQHAPPGGDRENRNADADRGDGHRCWRVTPGGSIADVVMPVTVLSYDAVD